METQDIVHNETPFEPTSEQTQRAAKLRRFNLLFVYVPVGLVTVIVIALVVVMLIVAINPANEDARLFLSGLADAALALALLPILMVGALLVGLAGYTLSQSRKKGVAPVIRTQRLLWRVDALVSRLRTGAERTAGMVAEPFLTVNGAVAYIRMLITQLVKIIKRS
ncbi:MAG: hypothetical protein PVH65_02980 [Chloroflexota bacterium]|jgi:uncharacterized integral membrane protein